MKPLVAPDASRHMGSKRPLDTLFVAMTVAAVVFAGLWPVVHFDRTLGEWRWFQGAYDEPYYLWESVSGHIPLGQRFLSSAPARLMSEIGITNFDTIAFVYSLVGPILMFTGAFLAAGLVTVAMLPRAILALFLMMAWDVLSGSSAVVYGTYPPAMALAQWLDMKWLLHADYMSFFVFLRRPEPQLSFSLFFLYITLLWRGLSKGNAKLYAFACALTPTLALVHINVAIIALLIFGMSSALVVPRLGKRFAIMFGGALLAALAAFWLAFQSSSAQSAASSLVFQSRLPVLRPSMLCSALGFAMLLALIPRRRCSPSAEQIFAAVLFAVPLITLNQQILTGLMVTPQNWETYGNYVCIVLGFAIVFKELPSVMLAPAGSVSSLAGPAVLICLIGLLVRGAILNAGYFETENLKSVALAKAYAEALSVAGPFEQVVLPSLADEALFITRVANAPPVVAGYGWLIHHQPRPLKDQEAVAQHIADDAASLRTGFEALARRGVSPEALKSSAVSELANGSCWPVLMYFFALRDCWPTQSSFRSPNPERILGGIGNLSQLYSAYLGRLQSDDRPGKTLVLMLTPIEGTNVPAAFKNRLIARTSIRTGELQASVYSYSQTGAMLPP